MRNKSNNRLRRRININNRRNLKSKIQPRLTSEDQHQRLVTVNYNLPSGPSYIGFPFNFPYDNSLATILRTAETPNANYCPEPGVGCLFTQIIGPAVAGTPPFDNFYIDPKVGYQVNSLHGFQFSLQYTLLDNPMHQLYQGGNWVAYTGGRERVRIEDALCGWGGLITNIAKQSMVKAWTANGWQGSNGFTELKRGEGYIINVSQDIPDFQFYDGICTERVKTKPQKSRGMTAPKPTIFNTPDEALTVISEQSGNSTVSNNRWSCSGNFQQQMPSGCSTCMSGGCNNLECCDFYGWFCDSCIEWPSVEWQWSDGGYWCGYACVVTGSDSPYDPGGGDDWPDVGQNLGRVEFPYWGCVTGTMGGDLHPTIDTSQNCEWACCAGRGKCGNTTMENCSEGGGFRNATFWEGYHCSADMNTTWPNQVGDYGYCDCNNNPDCDGTYQQANRECCEDRIVLSSCADLGLEGSGNWGECCSTDALGYPAGNQGDVERDCLGVCGGSAVEDDCGTCNGPITDCDAECPWTGISTQTYGNAGCLPGDCDPGGIVTGNNYCQSVCGYDSSYGSCNTEGGSQCVFCPGGSLIDTCCSCDCNDGCNNPECPDFSVLVTRGKKKQIDLKPYQTKNSTVASKTTPIKKMSNGGRVIHNRTKPKVKNSKGRFYEGMPTTKFDKSSDIRKQLKTHRKVTDSFIESLKIRDNISPPITSMPTGWFCKPPSNIDDNNPVCDGLWGCYSMTSNNPDPWDNMPWSGADLCCAMGNADNGGCIGNNCNATLICDNHYECPGGSLINYSPGSTGNPHECDDNIVDDDWPGIEEGLGRVTFPYWGCVDAYGNPTTDTSQDCEWACCAGKGKCGNVDESDCTTAGGFRNATFWEGYYCPDDMNVSLPTQVGDYGACDCNNNTNVSCDDTANTYTANDENCIECTSNGGPANRTCCENNIELSKCTDLGLVSTTNNFDDYWPNCEATCIYPDCDPCNGGQTVTFSGNPYITGQYILDSGANCPGGCLYGNDFGWCSNSMHLGAADNDTWGEIDMMDSLKTFCSNLYLGGGGAYQTHTETIIPAGNSNSNDPTLGSVWSVFDADYTYVWQCYTGHTDTRAITSITCCSNSATATSGIRKSPQIRKAYKPRRMQRGGRIDNLRIKKKPPIGNRNISKTEQLKANNHTSRFSVACKDRASQLDCNGACIWDFSNSMCINR